MKSLKFLAEIYRKGKLKGVEPSEELKSSYLKKSESNLSSAKILLKNEKSEESITLAYYSMYHILTALFYKIGIKSENHAVSIFLLSEIISIVIKNEDIASSFTTTFNAMWEISKNP